MAIGFLILVKSISLVFNLSLLFRCRFSLAHDDVGGSWARSRNAVVAILVTLLSPVGAVTTGKENINTCPTFKLTRLIRYGYVDNKENR